jgi:hypothetical protein
MPVHNLTREQAYSGNEIGVAFAWAAWINLIDFVVRRLAESVSISGAECDFWSGLNKLDF